MLDKIRNATFDNSNKTTQKQFKQAPPNHPPLPNCLQPFALCAGRAEVEAFIQAHAHSHHLIFAAASVLIDQLMGI